MKLVNKPLINPLIPINILVGSGWIERSVLIVLIIFGNITVIMMATEIRPRHKTKTG